MKLLDQVRDALRLRHYASETEVTYVHWIEQYIRFLKGPNGCPTPATSGRPGWRRT